MSSHLFRLSPGSSRRIRARRELRQALDTRRRQMAQQDIEFRIKVAKLDQVGLYITLAHTPADKREALLDLLRPMLTFEPDPGTIARIAADETPAEPEPVRHSGGAAKFNRPEGYDPDAIALAKMDEDAAIAAGIIKDTEDASADDATEPTGIALVEDSNHAPTAAYRADELHVDVPVCDR